MLAAQPPNTHSRTHSLQETARSTRFFLKTHAKSATPHNPHFVATNHTHEDR
jgi:hypothetical protein